MSEGEVKEVQGHAISVYGNVAIMRKYSRGTLEGSTQYLVSGGW